MKKIIALLAVFMLFIGTAYAFDSLEAAYRIATSEAGETTATLVENIDLQEFEDHFGLDLSEKEEMLIRIALMTYSNGAILEHPVGINSTKLATLLDETYVGNKKSRKFHYSWCSSVSDMAEKNKVTFDTREEAINEGYDPCQRCNP